MSSISWTLLHVCMRSRHFAAGAGTGGTSGSSSVEQRGGRLSGEQERVIARWRTHQRVSTAACSCSFVCRASSTKTSANASWKSVWMAGSSGLRVRPVLIRVHVCIVLCNNRVSVSSWEKSVIDSLRKAIYFSDHLPKAKGAGSFDPALRDRFFEMTPPIKDIRKRSFTIFRFEYDYFRSI